jgi:Spy/CpxP family protein refolding chaperone
MKTKLLWAILIVSLAFNAAVIGTMGFHWLRVKGFHHRPMNEHARVMRMKKTLGLNDEQVKLMEENRSKLDAEIAPLQERLQTKRKEMLTLLESEPAYGPKVEKAIAEISALQGDIEKAVIRNSFSVKTILTPDQQKKFREFMERGFRRMRPGEGRHFGRPPFGMPPPAAPEKEPK